MNSNVVVFLSPSPHSREPFLAEAARLAGWKTVLVYNQKPHYDVARHFDRVVQVTTTFEAMWERACGFAPRLLHVFGLDGTRIRPFMQLPRPCPVAIDIYDPAIDRCHTTPEQRQAEISGVALADGMTHRDLRFRISAREGILQLPPRNIFVSNPIDRTLVPPGLRPPPAPISVMHSGYIDGASTTLPLFQRLCDDGIAVRALIGQHRSTEDPDLAPYLRLAETNPLFQISNALSGREYWEAMAQSHFGLVGSSNQFLGRPFWTTNEVSLLGCSAMRLADCIAAGLGVITTPRLRHCYFLAKRYSRLVVEGNKEFVRRPGEALRRAMLLLQENPAERDFSRLTVQRLAPRLAAFYEQLAQAGPRADLATCSPALPVVPAITATAAPPAAVTPPQPGADLPAVAQLGDLGAARAALAKRDHLAAWTATLAALETRPFHPEAWLLLAETAQGAGDLTLARACAVRARQMVPHWRPAKKLQKALPARGQDKKVSWPAPPPPERPPRLSVFVITKNEERFLGQCLDSVKGLADQLIILDTGSTDRTMAIAREHGAEVHTRAWDDDFSAARNAALEHATGDWVLFLDADEEVSAEGRESLRASLRAPAVIAYRLPLLNVGREEDGSCCVFRLFRNAPGLFFRWRVHEQVYPCVLQKRDAWGLEIPLGTSVLRHHGYSEAILKDRNKVERNLRLLRRVVAEHPGEPMLLMSLGLELVRSGDQRAGLARYAEALQRMEAQPKQFVVPELRETLLMQYGTYLIEAKDYASAVRVLESRLANEAGPTASIHFMAGLAHLELKHWDAGAEQMRQCLAKRHQAALTHVHTGIRKAGPHHMLALCLAGAGRHEEVEQAFLNALAEDSGASAAQFNFARWLAERGRKLDALHLLHQLVAGGTPEPHVWRLGTQIALSEPDFIEFACDWTGEALAQLPGDAAMLTARAEALLLAGRAADALAVLDRVPDPTPLFLAARILAAVGSDRAIPVPDAVEEGAVTREFLRWYRRVVDFRGAGLVTKVHERLPELRDSLPAAAQILDAVVAEAAAPV